MVHCVFTFHTVLIMLAHNTGEHLRLDSKNQLKRATVIKLNQRRFASESVSNRQRQTDAITQFSAAAIMYHDRAAVLFNGRYMISYPGNRPMHVYVVRRRRRLYNLHTKYRQFSLFRTTNCPS